MKTKILATTAGVAALALTMWITPAKVQGQPMYDRIHVNLPYTITLGEKTLQPGDYTIQQLPDQGGGSRILLFYTDNGMKFETSAMTIPTLDPDTARDTKLILGHIGNDYYINKIWVQGKDYGYELPMPKALKERQNEKVTETTVAAQTQPATTDTAATTTTTSATPAQTEPAQTTPPPVTSQTEARPTETPVQNADQTHPVEPPVTPATPPVTPATPPVQADANSADRAMADQPPANTAPAPTRMPNTAANWMMMLLSGGTLSTAGLLLRRKR
jgi:hypothetical protein